MRQEEKGVKQMWGLKPERRLRGEGGVVRGFIAGQRGSGLKRGIVMESRRTRVKGMMFRGRDPRMFRNVTRTAMGWVL
jgi:hypothetical protein